MVKEMISSNEVKQKYGIPMDSKVIKLGKTAGSKGKNYYGIPIRLEKYAYTTYIETDRKGNILLQEFPSWVQAYIYVMKPDGAIMTSIIVEETWLKLPK